MQTSLLYQGRAESAAQRASTGTNQPQVIVDLDETIASNPNNAALPNNGKIVLATTDQPKFRLIPEIIKTGTVEAQVEADFTNAAKKKFKSATHEVEIYFNENESNNWNALFKPDKNGNYYFFGYNSDTGLGGILLDRDNNGLIDGAALYLRDNEIGDLNPDNYVIDDPVGLASIAEAPSLTINAAGNGLTVNGAAGTGLWLELQTTTSNANWQNSLTLHSSIRQTVKSIGATSQSNNLGKLEIYVQAGEEITFQQDSNQTNHASTSKLSIFSGSNGISLKLEDSKDNDYNDLIIDIKSKLTASSEADIRIANLQRNAHDSLFDFSWIESTGAKVQLDITSDCAYKNQLGLVMLDIDPVTGQHYDDYRINGISSDDLKAFHEEIIDNLVSPNGNEIIATPKSSQSITWEIDGSDAGIYAPVLITGKGDVLTAGLNTSSDGARHTKQFGLNHIGFEDMMASANPDWDFNDVTLKATLLTG